MIVVCMCVPLESSAADAKAEITEGLKAFRHWQFGVGTSYKTKPRALKLLRDHVASNDDAACAVATMIGLRNTSDLIDQDTAKLAYKIAAQGSNCPSYLAKIVEGQLGEASQSALTRLYAQALDGDAEAAYEMATRVLGQHSLAKYWDTEGYENAASRVYQVLLNMRPQIRFRVLAMHEICRKSMDRFFQAYWYQPWHQDLFQRFPEPQDLADHCARLKAQRYTSVAIFDWRPEPSNRELDYEYVNPGNLLEEGPPHGLDAIWPTTSDFILVTANRSDRYLTLVQGEFVRRTNQQPKSRRGVRFVEVVTVEDGIAGWVREEHLVAAEPDRLSIARAQAHLERGELARPWAILTMLAAKGDGEAVHAMAIAGKQYVRGRSSVVEGRTNLVSFAGASDYWFEVAAQMGYRERSNTRSPFPARPERVPGTITCNTLCNNGDCYRTYSDGRQVRLRARPVYDAAGNRWAWDPGSC